MGLPSEFMLTDVRCFAGEQRARLRPITLLVGENSTGKTTFLGCYSVLHKLFDWRRFHGPEPNFNTEPFSMGAFRDIVRAKNGSREHIKEFGVGVKMIHSTEDSTRLYSTKCIFVERGYQPSIESIICESDDKVFLQLILKDNNVWKVITEHDTWNMDVFFGDLMAPLFQSNFLDALPINKPYDKNTIDILEFKSYLGKVFMSNLPSIVPIAPLRSKPKRTYDPVNETVSPEGDHVPMLMMRLDRTGDERWKPLHRSLSAFGRESGMFSDIRVRRLGKHMSDPFQMQVKARSGTPANIMDVGYGVSQSLPILVDINSHRDSLFLLQQPEVHLHPRAQAELATVFADSVRENNNSFMIETHSDHIVDRMRILVRQGKIPAEDVSILYFEPVKNAVQIHNIEVDSDGNLENAPPGYRDFFLRESDRLLGFED